jgi:hypothetical protein
MEVTMVMTMKNESIGEEEVEEERRFVIFRASIVALAFPSTATTTATTIVFVMMLMMLMLSTM